MILAAPMIFILLLTIAFLFLLSFIAGYQLGFKEGYTEANHQRGGGPSTTLSS